MTAAKAKAKTLRVRQIRSSIGYEKRQRATLDALGLSKVGRVRTLPDNRQVRGMVSKIPHLVVIETDGPEGD